MENKDYFMTKPPITQSQKRSFESLAAKFGPFDGTNQESELIFLKSSSDIGVIRNGGRNGARFAPQSFLVAFKRLTQDEHSQKFAFKEVEVSSAIEEEEKDFHEAQNLEAGRIQKAVSEKSWICHIGGGHDHVYPLLKALSQNKKKVIVINVDAHADTRDDESHHSGTPFRQFSEEFSGEFHLFQVGLHPFANSKSTLANIKMNILWKNELSEAEMFFKGIEKLVTSETLVVFSLDADALDGSIVPGVSAVNGNGLQMRELEKLWSQYVKLVPHKPILGIYELNPVFDTLSMMSMRAMAAFVFGTLR